MSRSLLSFVAAFFLLGGSLFGRVPVVRADNPISPGFPYGTEKVRGVSLGGWLILHPWITPSLFNNLNSSVVDEWTFCEFQNTSVARAALENHWDTFYSEEDFANIAKAGLNHIRIPLGYWAFDVQPGEPYIQGQLPYLERAIKWATKYGLKVILALYGAPGSQNGFINSGHILSVPEWPFNQTDIDRTLAIIQRLESMFAKYPSVVPIIGALNEPAGFIPGVLDIARQYYRDAYTAIRFPFGSDKQSNTVMMIHDAFQPLSNWTDFMPPPDYQGVVMDTHIYQGFTQAELEQTEDEEIQEACAHAANITSLNLWTIVGEWCTAFTDCAPGLNGRGMGARYDGTYPNSTFVGSCDGLTGSAETFSDEYKAFMRRFWEAQTTSYETGIGWVQWLWKTEEGAGEEWSYSKGLQYGWIPWDQTDRLYPNICG
ncbi:hypothetical protein ACEPAI_228 [Sanghuangporus weigelae]